MEYDDDGIPPVLQNTLGVIEYKTSQPGVYFLVKDGIVVYVGQSRNAPNRIQKHFNHHKKDFDSAYYIECQVENLQKTELEYIRRLTPRYNRNGIPKPIKRKLPHDRVRNSAWWAGALRLKAIASKAAAAHRESAALEQAAAEYEDWRS